MDPQVHIGQPKWTNEAYDMDNKNQSSAIVIIYDHEKQDGRASAKEGRPVFKTEPFIKIDFPGDNLVSVDRPLRDADKLEYPQAWERYQKKEQVVMNGTPLAHWPMMTRLQVAELNSLNIWTVEQLVSLPQVHAHKVMGYEMLKNKALQFLDMAKTSANAEKVAADKVLAEAELAKRDEENKLLREQLSTQAIQIQALQTAIANIAQPKRRGRPPKVKDGPNPA